MTAAKAAQAAPPATVQWTVRPDSERYRQLLRWLFQGSDPADPGDDPPALTP